MTPSDYLLDGIIRDLAEFSDTDNRIIDHATVLLKNIETIELTIVTASSIESVAQTEMLCFRDEALGLGFLKAAGFPGVRLAGIRLILERGETVALQIKQRPDLHTAESMLNKIFEAERVSANARQTCD